MLIVLPGDSLGNRCPKRSATRAISSPLRRTRHSPAPWTPLVCRRSSVYWSIANETTGFCSMWRAVVVFGFDQKYSIGPSFT